VLRSPKDWPPVDAFGAQVLDETRDGGACPAAALHRRRPVVFGVQVGGRGEVRARHDPGEHVWQGVEAAHPGGVVEPEERADALEVTADAELGDVVPGFPAIDVGQAALAVLQVEAPADAPDEVAQVVETHERPGALEIGRREAEEVRLQVAVHRREHVADDLGAGDAQRRRDAGPKLGPGRVRAAPGRVGDEDVEIAEVRLVAVGPRDAIAPGEQRVEGGTHLGLDLEIGGARHPGQVVQVAAHARLRG
jgi:hypothetical protein